MSPVHPSENRCLFAIGSELVLRVTAVGLAVLALLLLWLEYGRAGLGTIAVITVVLASNRFNSIGRQRLAFVLAPFAILVLGFLLQQLIGWSGGTQWPLLALAMVCLLNRRWDRSFRVSVSSLLLVAATLLIFLPTAHIPTLMTSAQSMVWLILITVAAVLFTNAVRQAEALAARVRQVTRTDILTGLLDRDAMKDTLGYEAARCHRSQKPFAAVLAKVDDFSILQQRYGDRCGDWVLVTIANLLRRILRQQDYFARWDDEEFMMLLPDTNAQGGRFATDRIRTEIDRSTYLFDGKEIDFTLTFAVVVFDGTQSVARCLEDLNKAVGISNAPGFIVVSDPEESPE